MRLALRSLATLLLLASAAAHAHENLAALLAIEQRAPVTFEMTWRVPAVQGGAAPEITPRLPADCITLGHHEEVAAIGARVRHFSVRCDGRLEGGARIAFDGLPATNVDALVRIRRLDGSAESLIARPRAPWVEVGSVRHIDVAGYFALGVEHILLGLDHLLFVFCLVLLVGGVRRIVTTVTAFTVAHSLTLALATLGWLTVAPAPVEATIALSILFLARELALPRASGATRRWPWIVAFSFGLLHGLGFAGALAEVGLPRDAVAPALLLFNLGVEAGQLAFVAVVLGLLAAVARIRLAWPRWCLALPAYAAGTVSGFWWLQRVAAMVAP
ncbi:MAG TPA: HupE/UreJ family protein [Usitatibacter sp.]|nr:HupE/UreJ family protein [Usitatibacter sp.]